MEFRSRLLPLKRSGFISNPRSRVIDTVGRSSRRINTTAFSFVFLHATLLDSLASIDDIYETFHGTHGALKHHDYCLSKTECGKYYFSFSSKLIPRPRARKIQIYTSPCRKTCNRVFKLVTELLMQTVASTCQSCIPRAAVLSVIGKTRMQLAVIAEKNWLSLTSLTGRSICRRATLLRFRFRRRMYTDVPSAV